jgi:NAD(P)H-nitrite reductase large subunit
MAEIVCDCVDVEYTDIVESVKKHGDNIDAIMDETEAGTVCECCLEDDCDKVDIPLKAAIKKALTES